MFTELDRMLQLRILFYHTLIFKILVIFWRYI